MEWLNYHHLRYFWFVVREGTIAAACKRLHVAQPTVSAQLRALERAVGERLFKRSGRSLILTDTGRMVYRYADDIFALGDELLDTINGRPSGSPLRFSVGVADVLPKLVAFRLLQPVLELPEKVQLVCYEGGAGELFAKLALHELDMALSDSPVGPEARIKAFSHLLGECGVSILGTAEMVGKYHRGFPKSLDGAPMLLPTESTSLRRAMEEWFEAQDVRVAIAAEFADRALLKEFGQAGVGLLAAPTIIEQDVERQYRLKVVGRLDAVRERYYAISGERRVKHPAVAAIAKAARERVFV